MSRGSRFGNLYIIAAALLWSLAGVCVKFIPWSAYSIACFRSICGALVFCIYMRRPHITFSKWNIAGALAMFLTGVLYMSAIKLTTAANAIVLQFTAPVFVILLMALLYRSRPTRPDIVTCFAVLFGVCLFFIDGISAGNLPGNLIAVLSGICYAGVFMMNTGRNADALSSCFLGQLAGGLLFTPLCFSETDFSLPTLTAVLALGVIQVGGAYILFSEGIRNTPPVAASLITGMEPIMNPVWVALFYGETLSPLSLVGSVIVIGSIVIYNVILARKK